MSENEIIENKETIATPATTSLEETPDQINWKKFREQREIERRAKEESDKIAKQKTIETEALKAALEAIVNKPSQNQQTNYQTEDETEEQRIKKHVDAALEERDRRYAQERQQNEVRQLPATLNASFKDFDNICSSENLDYLQYHHPELATTLSKVPDSFEKWAAIYNTVKKLVPNPNNQENQRKAANNAMKPQSMSVPGQTQTGDSAPVIIDDAKRKANWDRMQRTMKGVK